MATSSHCGKLNDRFLSLEYSRPQDSLCTFCVCLPPSVTVNPCLLAFGPGRSCFLDGFTHLPLRKPPTLPTPLPASTSLRPAVESGFPLRGRPNLCPSPAAFVFMVCVQTPTLEKQGFLTRIYIQRGPPPCPDAQHRVNRIASYMNE